MDSPAIIILFIVVAVVIAGIGAWLSAKRRKELQEWALANGLHYSRAKDRSYDNVYPFKSLDRGSNRYAHNIISGDRHGRDWRAFDYHYETYSTDSKGRRQTHHHHFSAIIITLPFPLGDLHIRPEGFFDKVTEFFGLDDIDFESTEFSDKFHVAASERKWAFDVLHARAIQWLLDHRRFTIAFGGCCALIRDGEKTFSIERLEEADEVLRGLLDQLPEYVLRELQSQRGIPVP